MLPTIVRKAIIQTRFDESNLDDIMAEQINSRIDAFTRNGSGLVIHYLKVRKYDPLKASSYIKLLSSISSKGATSRTPEMSVSFNGLC